MKTTPLIAIILVVTALACQKTIPEAATNLRPLGGAPAKHDSTKAKPADTTKAKPTDTTKPVTKADTTVVPPPPFPQQPVNNGSGAAAPGCPVLPIYGDSLIFTQPASGDYIVHPVNNPGTGKYFSWPAGMVLDQNTGAINLTQSETGMKYILGFVKSGTKDTCLSTLIIGGAAYFDSVYVLANGQTAATPYFEANPYLPSVCANGGCTFDVNGAAAAQKVIVNKSTGVIDLQKTLNGSGGLTGLLGGAFGLIPVNGQSLTTTIYYRINYGSNNALQQIRVQLQYYDKKSLINVTLLNGLINAVDRVLSGNVISTSVSPRPPLVIITRYQ